MTDAVTRFYRHHLREALWQHSLLQVPCPFCSRQRSAPAGTLSILLNPESFFHGYFHCSNRCVRGGFPLQYARLSGISPSEVPGHDPDRAYFGCDVEYPVKNITQELVGFAEQLTDEPLQYLRAASIDDRVLAAQRIGYNGRYLVYPYIQNDGNCYAARCVHPERPEDFFWYGDDRFAGDAFRVFNGQDIEACENGALLVVEDEKNLLPIKQIGLPGIAVPTAADLEHLDPRRLQWIRTIFLWVNHSPESEAMAKNFATRFGYKVRIVRWPEQSPRQRSIFQLACDTGAQFHKKAFALLHAAKAFSPFPSPAGEYQIFRDRLLLESGSRYSNLQSGFARLDRALDGIHGLNILGGPPKAGKSAFIIQMAATMALHKLPVIYYDFENGRQKIYLRILSRFSRLTLEQIKNPPSADADTRLQQAQTKLQAMLQWLRVVNDRTLSPEIMRRHIDFLRHETQNEYTVVVIDSLHKLPFKDISQKRSGIDGWLRQLEAIRDELGVSFLVISELERDASGHFDHQPHLGSFKGSGDIGYSADNALVLVPRWDPFVQTPPTDRRNELWVVASREQSPGRVASYRVDYPFWGFIEED